MLTLFSRLEDTGVGGRKSPLARRGRQHGGQRQCRHRRQQGTLGRQREATPPLLGPHNAHVAGVRL